MFFLSATLIHGELMDDLWMIHGLDELMDYSIYAYAGIGNDFLIYG
jgi:hypothetical protein